MASVPGAPVQAPYANLWYPTVAAYLRHSTFTGAALVYNLVDWQPGYVERSACRLLDGGVLNTGPVAALPYGPGYIYVVYRIQCTDMWGGPRYGDIVQLLPKLQCPANSVQEGSACNCNPGFVEDGAVCTAFAGRPIEDDGAMCQAGAQVGHPIVPATGEKVLAHVDYAGFGAQPLGFVRHFRSAWVNRPGSARPTTSPLGASWSHSHVVTLTLGGAPASSALIRFGDGEVALFGRAAGQSGWVGVNTADQLEATADAFVLTRDADGSTFIFDPSGRLTRVVQRNQWQTSYSYSDAATPLETAAQPGLLTRVSNQFGTALQFQYSAAGQLKALISPGGETVRYGYDAAQRLITITHPGEEVQTLLYEDSRWPDAVTGLIDERGIRLATYSYDELGRAVQTEHALGVDRHSVRYGATAGDPVVVTDALGTQRSYSYATVANRLTVSSADLPSGTPGNEASRRIQNASGLVETETDYLGVTTARTWDQPRRLPVSLTRAVGTPVAQTTLTQWHARWRLPVSVTEERRTALTDYDALGNVLSHTVTDNATGVKRVNRWSYNDRGLVATTTDPLGRVTVFSHDARGNRVSSTDALGRITQLAYDAHGRLARQHDPGGLVTEWQYDARGRLIAHRVAGEQTLLTYLPSGQVSRITLPDGHTVNLAYDAAQRLVRYSDNRGNVVDYVLDGMGNRVWENVTDASGNTPQTMRRVVDRLNRIEAIVNGVGQTTRMAFDANGELASQSDGLGQTTRQRLDALRRVTSTVFADNAEATLQWDSLDQASNFVDPKAVATRYVRNAWGEVLQESSPDFGTVSYVRDAAGQVVTRTDGRGQKTLILRDALGRTSQLSLPGGNTQQFSYDLAGRITQVRDSSGLTSLQYDTAGRLLQKRQSVLLPGLPVAVRTVTYQYQPGGGLAEVGYPSGLKVTYRRNAAGLISSVDVRLHGTRQVVRPFVRDLVYTASGLPSAWNWASGDSARREFDAAGRMTGNEFASYAYDAASRITGIQQRLWSVPRAAPGAQTLAPSAVQVPWSVGYDRRDRIVRFDRAGHTAAFVYDNNSNRVGASELIAVASDFEAPVVGTSDTRAVQQTIFVDAASNRMTGFSQSQSSSTAGVSASSTSAVTYAHDAVGNMLSNGTRRLEYDDSNRLSKTVANTSRGPAETRYLHNALGQRVFKSEPVYVIPGPGSNAKALAFTGWVRRVFGPSASQVVTTWLTSNMPAATGSLGNAYVYADGALGEHSLLGEYGNGGVNLPPGNEIIWLPVEGGLAIPIGLVSGGRLYAIHTDHLNTPRLITDDNNRPVWQWPYSAFGDNKPTGVLKSIPDPRQGATGAAPLLRATAPVIEFNLRYPGQFFDQESGLHYNYFRSYQPSTGRYTQPDPIGLEGGMNLYGYADGSPMTRTDPLGLKTYRCIRPLSGKPGANRRNGPDIWGNPSWHQYSCVSDPASRGVGFICGGQAPAGRLVYGPGKPTNPSEDYYHPDACEKTQDDNTCFESCMVEKWSQSRPNYGWPTAGRDCKEYDNDVNATCRKRCRLK